MRHRGHRFPFGQPGAGQQQSALRAPARERQAGFGDEQARQRPSAGADPAAPFLYRQAAGRILQQFGRDGAQPAVGRHRQGHGPRRRRRELVKQGVYDTRPGGVQRRVGGPGDDAQDQLAQQRIDVQHAGLRRQARIDVRIEEQAAKRVAARHRHAVLTAAWQPGRLQRRQLADAVGQEQRHAALRLEQQLSAPVTVPARGMRAAVHAQPDHRAGLVGIDHGIVGVNRHCPIPYVFDSTS